MRIVIVDGYTVNPGDNPWDELKRYGEVAVYERTAPGEMIERAQSADIILTNKAPLRAEMLARLPALKFIAVTATGYDCVDVVAARSHGVPVANVPEYVTDGVAQHVFALLLEMTSHVALHQAAVARGEWSNAQDFSIWLKAPIELAGKTMGLIGVGRIGRRVAQIARAFGMEVIAANRNSAASLDGVRIKTIEQVFAEADVVSLHCPLGENNRRFVDAALLARMKPTAMLINTARGGLVDEQALADALHHQRLAGAAVDVVSEEPIRSGNPLLQAPNCLITPHMAWASLAARRRLVKTTVDNVAAFVSGQPIHLVN